jgi:Tol biopolymer transport system component
MLACLLSVILTVTCAAGDELALVRHDGDNYSLCLWQPGMDEPRTVSKLPGECSRLSWSPDGSRLVASVAFGDKQGLWLCNGDGGVGRRLKTINGIDAGDAVFSPDGEWIYYTTDSSEGGTIRRIRLSDERDEAIMDIESGGGATGWIGWLLWSQDGNALYYMKDEGWEEWHLWRFDPANGEQTALWEEPCGTPAESPDGRLLMWASGDDPAQVALLWFAFNPETGELERGDMFAEEAPWQSMPSFSPDGKTVAYVAGKGEEAPEGSERTVKASSAYEVTDIWLKPVEGGEPERLPGKAALGRDFPAWKPRHD